jgi:hypothetical protein
MIPILCSHYIEQDDKEAVQKSNILKERTRGVKVQKGTYSEGPDEDDLPESARSGDVGRSAIGQ